MLTFVLFLFATFAQFVLGQVVSPPAGTPQCLITCGLQYCPTAELQCECVDQFSNISICVLQNCSTSDVTTAGQIAAQICGASASSSASATESASGTATTTVAVTSSAASVTSSTPGVSSASSAVESASSALSSASVALSSASASASSASASASHSGSAAASSGAPTSDANRLHNSAIGVMLLGLAGIAAGFALL